MQYIFNYKCCYKIKQRFFPLSIKKKMVYVSNLNSYLCKI